MKKENIIQILIICVLLIILVVLIIFAIKSTDNWDAGMMNRGMMIPPEENKEKETKSDDVESGIEVSNTNIDLNEYSTNVTINKSGVYTLTGTLKNSVLVDADSEVTLILNNVDIQVTKTAAIANIGTNDITIKLANNSINKISDAGSSEYDGCLFSNGNLTIEGNGTLNVFGGQDEGEGIAAQSKNITINSGIINIECNDDGLNAGGDGGQITINGGEVYIKAKGDGIDSNKNLVINGGSVYTIGSSAGGDAGIDTDTGFEINGGTVIALGSDMLERPKDTSKQKSICLSLGEKFSEGTKISIKNEKEEEIISFEAKEDFKTLIVSNSKVISGEKYIFYENDVKTRLAVLVD